MVNLGESIVRIPVKLLYSWRNLVPSEKSISALALVISISALVVSIWQGVDNRNFNELSVKPHLQINPKLTGDSESGLYIENAGTGTAFINSISIRVNDKTFNLIEDNTSILFEFIRVKPDCYRESWPRKGAAIQAGKEFPLIQVTKADVAVCNLETIKLLTEPNMIMNIEYTTPYGELLNFSDNISLTEREFGVYSELINSLRNITTE